MKKVLVILVVVLAARWLAAQGTTADSCAPLMLYTNGAGSFSPYHCGQMLQTGQVYTVSAIPNHGYRFHDWQKVKVAVAVKTIIYPSSAIVITTNTVITPTVVRNKEATMKINISAPTVEVREDNPGTTVTTKSSGWQANFARSGSYESWSKMY